jgi:hypothetical protein
MMANFIPQGPQYPLDKRVCGPRNRSGSCEREKNPLLLPRSETRFLSRSVRNLVASLLSYLVSNRFTFMHVSAYFHSVENASTSLYKYAIQKRHFLICGRGETESPLYAGLYWPYSTSPGWWWQNIDEREAVGSMGTGKGNQGTWRKSTTVVLRLPHVT